MAKQTNWIPIVLVLGVVAIAAGWISLPSAVPAGPAPIVPPQGLLTGNPSFNITILDSRTQSVLNEATVRLLDSSGQLRATANTGSGVAAFTNLDPSTTYTMEVLPISGTTAFYPFSASITSLPAGSKTAVFTYKSETTVAPTVTVYNNDDLTVNTTAQAIAANEEVTFRIRIRPAASTNDNNHFGDGVSVLNFAVDYNNVAIVRLSMKEGQTAMGSGNSVTGHAVQDVNKNATLYFNSVSTSLSPATNYDFYLNVKAGTIEPVMAGLVSASDDEIYVTVYDGCRIQNTQTGQYAGVWRDAITQANICSANGVSGIEYT